MKKSILAVLLAVALVAPVFAADQKKGLELIPKVSYLFAPEVTSDFAGSKKSYSKDASFGIGADLFFDMDNNFFLGAGLMFGTNHAFIDGNNDFKLGFTNLYAALKYKVLVNKNESDPFYVYPLLNLGFGFPGYEIKTVGPDPTIDGGLYWGLGVGGEYKNIILEFMYGCNYATMKLSGKKYDASYTAFRINVGYKFSL